MFEGQAPMTGLSLIVTLNEQLEVPHPLVAVHVTAVVPAENVEPDAGLHDTIGVVPVDVGSVHVAVVLSHCVIGEGHAPITGGTQFCISQSTPEYPGGQSQPQARFTVPPFWQAGAEVTITLNVHVLLPHGLNAVHVTVVVPTKKFDPEDGEQFTVATGKPVAVGSVHVAGPSPHWLISDGHALITGVSLIVTLNGQNEVPQEFVAVQVTVDCPVGKVEPDAGLHTTVAAGVPVDGGVGKNTT
jgi:hypothetical protein